MATADATVAEYVRLGSRVLTLGDDGTQSTYTLGLTLYDLGPVHEHEHGTMWRSSVRRILAHRPAQRGGGRHGAVAARSGPAAERGRPAAQALLGKRAGEVGVVDAPIGRYSLRVVSVEQSPLGPRRRAAGV
ncbi:MAG TPA: hypothetical protein VGL99_28780 [Chloroflexota bacterium]